MTTYYVSKDLNDSPSDSNPGSISSPFLTIQRAINACSTSVQDTVIVSAGVYNEEVVIEKSIILKGARYSASGIDNGAVRNSNETIVRGLAALPNTNPPVASKTSQTCFTIKSSNVTIDGFTCILPSDNGVINAFNLLLPPQPLPSSASSSDISSNTGFALMNNININNNVIQSLRNGSGNYHSILFGECTIPGKISQYYDTNGNGKYQNINITNNYFDCSNSSNGHRGIQISTHFYQVTLEGVLIENNKFVNSSNITSNGAIGVTSYIAELGRGPTLFNNFKIKNNVFETPANTAIRGLNDCDKDCEISGNIFTGLYGMSVNFRELGGKIQRNTFNMSSSGWCISVSDGQYATSDGSLINITDNIFNSVTLMSSQNFSYFLCDSPNYNICNLLDLNEFKYKNITVNNCASIIKTTTYQYKRNGNSTYLPRYSIIVYALYDSTLSLLNTTGITDLVHYQKISKVYLDSDFQISPPNNNWSNSYVKDVQQSQNLNTVDLYGSQGLNVSIKNAGKICLKSNNSFGYNVVSYVILTVNKATPSFTGISTSVSKTYGDVFSLIPVSSSTNPNFMNPLNWSYTLDNTLPAVVSVDQNKLITCISATQSTSRYIYCRQKGTNNFNESQEISVLLTINKKDLTLQFSLDFKEYGAAEFDPLPLPLPPYTHDGTVTYTSSNPNVAVISSNNKVKITGPGSSTITAQFSSTSNCNSGSKTATLIVKLKMSSGSDPIIKPLFGP